MSNPGQPSAQSTNPLLPVPPPEVVEEYRIIRESAANTSDRRQRTNDVFVGINALFLSGLGLLLVSSHLNLWEAVIETAAISAAVLPVNWAWLRGLAVYHRVLATHYQCLQEIESRFRFAANLTMKLGADPVGSASGVRLARYFIAIYPLTTVAVALLTYANTNHLLMPLPTAH